MHPDSTLRTRYTPAKLSPLMDATAFSCPLEFEDVAVWCSCCELRCVRFGCVHVQRFMQSGGLGVTLSLSVCLCQAADESVGPVDRSRLFGRIEPNTFETGTGTRRNQTIHHHFWVKRSEPQAMLEDVLHLHLLSHTFPSLLAK